MKILLIMPYPLGEAPSQRFRFEQYLSILNYKGFEITVKPFFKKQTWTILYKNGMYFRKTLGVLSGFTSRIGMLFSVHRYDFVFIHREASPLGPPIFEFLIAKIFLKKIIFDFDDAIWIPTTSNENVIAAKIKWHSKTALICRWSYKVSCGNEYLCNYAKQYNKNVVLNPTTIDTESLHNPALHQNVLKETGKVTIGWTGTHSTLKYLETVVPLFKNLLKNFPNQIRFLVIADKKPEWDLTLMDFLLWAKQSEVEDLMKFDIGIMPLTDDTWAQGKCGFKALQYMSLQIPTIASPVGVNTEIINHEENGFLCTESDEWLSILARLISDVSLRDKIGKSSRKTVIDKYSIKSNTQTFLGLFA